MVSGKLIQLIEAHQEQIAANVIREIRRHPDLSGLRKLSVVELRERGQQILEHLGHWLAAGNEAVIRSFEFRVSGCECRGKWKSIARSGEGSGFGVQALACSSWGHQEAEKRRHAKA